MASQYVYKNRAIFDSHIASFPLERRFREPMALSIFPLLLSFKPDVKLCVYYDNAQCLIDMR